MPVHRLDLQGEVGIVPLKTAREPEYLLIEVSGKVEPIGGQDE